jgi:hypothetical protein
MFLDLPSQVLGTVLQHSSGKQLLKLPTVSLSKMSLNPSSFLLGMLLGSIGVVISRIGSKGVLQIHLAPKEGCGQVSPLTHLLLLFNPCSM